MNEGWIKLYRKSKDNPLMRDLTAWGIFSWIMLTVDRKTGEMTLGRFWASEYFGINPSTFYKALQRLEKKYKVVTLSSNNKCTTVKLLNWAKYQPSEEAVTQDGNNKVTTKEQQSNTLTRSRELRSIIPVTKQRVAVCSNKEEGHKGCLEYIDSLADSRGVKFPNYAKQIKALHKMLAAPYTFQQINKKIDTMEKKRFWADNGFDLMNVANEIGKGGV